MHLTPNGSLDSAFGSNGQVVLPFASLALAVTASGQILTMNYGTNTVLLARSNSNGELDQSFGTQKIFNEVPAGALAIHPLCMDWTFYCYECGSMASMKTCPHNSKAVIDENGNYKGGARLLLSGTLCAS